MNTLNKAGKTLPITTTYSPPCDRFVVKKIKLRMPQISELVPARWAHCKQPFARKQRMNLRFQKHALMYGFSSAGDSFRVQEDQPVGGKKRISVRIPADGAFPLTANLNGCVLLLPRDSCSCTRKIPALDENPRTKSLLSYPQIDRTLPEKNYQATPTNARDQPRGLNHAASNTMMVCSLIRREDYLSSLLRGICQNRSVRFCDQLVVNQRYSYGVAVLRSPSRVARRTRCGGGK